MVFADDVRLRIAAALLDGESSAEELASELHLSPPSVSHHLDQLAELGLVRACERRGAILYRFDVGSLRQEYDPSWDNWFND